MNITISTWLMMIFCGILESMKSLLVPYFQQQLSLTPNQTGLLLSVSFYGVVLTNLLIGIVFNRTEVKKIMLFSLTIMAIALIGFSVSFPYTILILLMLILGSGISGVGMASNTVTAVLHPNRAGQMFIMLHAFFGIGALIGPIVIQRVLDYSSWSAVFIGLAIFPLFLLSYLTMKKVPSGKMAKLKLSDMVSLLKEKSFSKFVIVKFCYAGAELGFVTWMIGFLQEEHLFTPQKAALYVSLFFATFTIGRLLGSFIVERIGYFIMLILHCSLAIVCLVATVYGPTEVMWVFIIYGFTLSIIFPTITTIASKVYSDKISAVFGFLYAASGLGGALTTWLIGFVYENSTYRTAFLIPLMMLIVVFIVILSLKKTLGNVMVKS